MGCLFNNLGQKFNNILAYINSSICISHHGIHNNLFLSPNNINNGINDIKLEFIDGLNDDPSFQLNKNSEGYYELFLNKYSNQTIQRITAKLTKNDLPIRDNYGNIQPKLIEWESNLYWWF